MFWHTSYKRAWKYASILKMILSKALKRRSPVVMQNSFDSLEVTRFHYNDVMMGTLASQITSLTIVYSIVYSDADQRKHQSSASLAFVRGIHRGPLNSPHKWPVTRKLFPVDDVIMSFLKINDYSTISQSSRLRISERYDSNIFIQENALKMSSAKCRLFCIGLNGLMRWHQYSTKCVQRMP